ncbi:DUF636 domain-containing protein [Mollisia scopiformis]|uniref:DUF636 domain-containing protein n=1 Tax=Mollisia scopiformis TaxID=149040 RepID=A0A194X555_MOLSC|nr:DUF636 domain-containing protein [Mollisia scopiformis]KUJ15311.1 DUF636 domain-containing protein [Mollisia scopiformis]
MSETAAPKRQACPGSCHCGFTQYIVFLILPHPFSSSHPPPPHTGQEVYRCNCRTCYKMNFFHVHPAHPRDDFMLLSPLDPDRDLSTYFCCEKKRKFYFCPKCGVRCFTFSGVGETTVVDVPGEEGKREVWQAKWDGGMETRPYVSVNGTTIDAREDFDLRVLTEEKRVQYFDDRSELGEKKEERWDRPHYGGSY